MPKMRNLNIAVLAIGTIILGLFLITDNIQAIKLILIVSIIIYPSILMISHSKRCESLTQQTISSNFLFMRKVLLLLLVVFFISFSISINGLISGTIKPKELLIIVPLIIGLIVLTIIVISPKKRLQLENNHKQKNLIQSPENDLTSKEVNLLESRLEIHIKFIYFLISYGTIWFVYFNIISDIIVIDQIPVILAVNLFVVS